MNNVYTKSVFMILSGTALQIPVAYTQPLLEEVLVTAQKRTQSLQEIPISLSVFDSEDIKRRGITNIGDIKNFVPNLNMKPFEASQTTLQFFIRGLGAIDRQITRDSPVGVYMDGVYMARTAGLALAVADIMRIEVLRGPQGTLYGRNTTGGAINIITRPPSDQFEFSQLFSFGKYDQFRSKTTVNLPLGERFALKLAYQHNERDGWIENFGLGEDFNKYDSDAYRVDMRWTPVDDFTVEYSYDFSESDLTNNYIHLDRVSSALGLDQVLSPQPNRVDEATLAVPFEESDEETSGHALTLTKNTSFGELKSITAYRKLEQKSYQDYSGNPIISVFINDPGTMDQDQWSQEFQLVGANTKGTIEYIAGLYYFSEEGVQQEINRIPLFSFVDTWRVEAKNTSKAFYGQLTWHPQSLSSWSFTVGGRYTEDKREADNMIQQKASAEFSNFTPSFTASYALNDANRIYGKVVTGYKSGGFNIRQTEFTREFNEEDVITYEAGWKSEPVAGRFRFNGAIFLSDYNDMQLDILVPNQPDPTLTRTENAGEAEIYGLEADATIQLTNSLKAKLSYGYLKNDVEKVEGDNADFYSLPSAPENSYTVTIDWDVLSFSDSELNLSIDHSWKDSYRNISRVEPNQEFVFVDDYGVTDAQLTLTGDDWFGKGQYRIGLWIKNAFDEKYMEVSAFSFGGIHADRFVTYGSPRMYGIDLEYQY